MPKSSSACCRRQSLEFGDLSEAVAHGRSLQDTGYQQLGNWSLGQVCNHLAGTMEFSIDGFPSTLPTPVAAVMRTAFFYVPFMPRIISRLRAPTLPALAQADPVEDAAGLQRLADAVARVSAANIEFQRNPILGRLTPEQWHRFHVWHAQHHLSFLKPVTDEATAGNCCSGDVAETAAVSSH